RSTSRLRGLLPWCSPRVRSASARASTTAPSRRTGRGASAPATPSPPGSCPTPAPSTTTTTTTATLTVTTTSVADPAITTSFPPDCNRCCFGQFAFTTRLPQNGTGGCENTRGVTTAAVTDDTNPKPCNLAAHDLYFR